GLFVLKEALLNLTSEAIEHPIDWYRDFAAWQRASFLEELRKSAQVLAEATNSDIRGLGERLVGTVGRAANQSLLSTFGSLATEVTAAQRLVTSIKDGTDARIKDLLNLVLNGNRTFLDELARLIDSLQEDTTDPDELEEIE